MLLRSLVSTTGVDRSLRAMAGQSFDDLLPIIVRRHDETITGGANLDPVTSGHAQQQTKRWRLARVVTDVEDAVLGLLQRV